MTPPEAPDNDDEEDDDNDDALENGDGRIAEASGDFDFAADLELAAAFDFDLGGITTMMTYISANS